MSVVAAAIARYNSISAGWTVHPPIWFSGIPQTDASGTALSTTTGGYVNLVDEGTSVNPGPEAGYDFEYHPIEATTLRFEVYGPTLEFVDLIMTRIKYSTGAVTAGAGFDFGTLTIVNQTEMECRRTHERREKAPQASETGGYVYQGTIWYTVQAQVT